MKITKCVITAILSLAISHCALADTSVRGYQKSNGTYVAPHHRSSPDRTTHNNWSSYGNSNPYTGKHGTNRGSSRNGDFGYRDHIATPAINR